MIKCWWQVDPKTYSGQQLPINLPRNMHLQVNSSGVIQVIYTSKETLEMSRSFYKNWVFEWPIVLNLSSSIYTEYTSFESCKYSSTWRQYSVSKSCQMLCRIREKTLYEGLGTIPCHFLHWLILEHCIAIKLWICIYFVSKLDPTRHLLCCCWPGSYWFLFRCHSPRYRQLVWNNTHSEGYSTVPFSLRSHVHLKYYCSCTWWIGNF